MNPIHEKQPAIFRWWPIIAFTAIQLTAAGVIYGDIRARLTSIEATLKSNTFITRAEVNLMVRDAERIHAELKDEVVRLRANGRQ